MDAASGGVCRGRYARRCADCGDEQFARDIAPKTLSFTLPAITAEEGDLITLSLYSVYADEDTLLPAATNGFAVEAWTVDDEKALPALPVYVSGITSNKLVAENIIKNKGMTVTAPTCSEQGYTAYVCSCGAAHRDDFVPATGEHSYENGICSVCGEAQDGLIILAQPTTDTVRLDLEVKDELAILQQPTTDSATPGEKATVTVEAQGDALTYQWYYKDAGQARFIKSSIKSATYTLTLTESNYNRVLYCVISDAFGNQVTTETVTLTVSEN